MKKGYIAAGILAIVATLALVLGLVLRSDDEFDKDSKDDDEGGAQTPPVNFERLVSLNGTENFRDLGGYETLDDQWMKTGKKEFPTNRQIMKILQKGKSLQLLRLFFPP